MYCEYGIASMAASVVSRWPLNFPTIERVRVVTMFKASEKFSKVRVNLSSLLHT